MNKLCPQCGGLDIELIREHLESDEYSCNECLYLWEEDVLGQKSVPKESEKSDKSYVTKKCKDCNERTVHICLKCQKSEVQDGN